MSSNIFILLLITPYVSFLAFPPSNSLFLSQFSFPNSTYTYILSLSFLCSVASKQHDMVQLSSNVRARARRSPLFSRAADDVFAVRFAECHEQA